MKQIRWIILLMVSALFLAAFPLGAGAQDAEPEGWGDPDGDGVYYINSVDDLYGFLGTCTSVNGYMKGKTVVLLKDLDLNPGWKASSGTKPANVWLPLYQFSGTFDGQGHSISGLYVEQSTGGSAFIVRANGATIQNLSILNSYFLSTSKDFVGSFCASANGAPSLFENLYSEAIVEGKRENGTYIDMVGGIIGGLYNGTATLNRVVFNGTVIGGKGVGGLVGVVNAVASTLTATDCASYGTMQASGDHNGGLVGICRGNLSMTRCFNACTVPSSDAYSGALAYLECNIAKAQMTLTDCYYLSGTRPHAITAWHNWYRLEVSYDGTVTGSVNAEKNSQAWTDHTAWTRSVAAIEELTENSVFSAWSTVNGLVVPTAFAFLINGHVHDYAAESIHATCTEAGRNARICAACGCGYASLISPSGHQAGEWVTDIQPTETAVGHKHLNCTVCDQVLEEEILPAIPGWELPGDKNEDPGSKEDNSKEDNGKEPSGETGKQPVEEPKKPKAGGCRSEAASVWILLAALLLPIGVLIKKRNREPSQKG